MADIFEDLQLEELRRKRIEAEAQEETPLTEGVANLFDAGSLIGTYGKDAAGLLRALGVNLDVKRANIPKAEADAFREETAFKATREKDRREKRKEDQSNALTDVKMEVKKKELREGTKATPSYNAAETIVKTLENRLKQILRVETKKGEFLTGDEAAIKEDAEAKYSDAANLLAEFRPKTKKDLNLFKEQLRRLDAARKGSE